MSNFLRTLAVAPLSRDTFHPFGDVLDAAGASDYTANGGAAQVFRDRAKADYDAEGGRICFNVVRTAPRTLPLRIELLERHPLSSQLFSPLASDDWLVVVAPSGTLRPEAIVAFQARPDQAVSYARGVWHHPLIALHRSADFLVVDRAGEGSNLEIEHLAAPLLLLNPVCSWVL
jgi:ureidoglycolate lyase